MKTRSLVALLAALPLLLSAPAQAAAGRSEARPVAVASDFGRDVFDNTRYIGPRKLKRI